MIEEFKTSYRQHFEETLINEIIEVGIFKEVNEGHKLIDIGEYLRGMPLLISGAIKILREDSDDGELLLYYLERGDTCSMTMTCCMGNTKSEIRAIAEMDTKIVLVPIQKMELWIAKYKSWRNFVFESYHNRLNELLHTLDSIAFNAMDQRLLDYIKEKRRIVKNDIIKNTHQEIAYDLNSSRVVISRLLKKLERLGHVDLHRNYIKVLNL
ncbi:Crp/Fnr family transcriptional regulator [Winogradskyella sp.]|uniref:Crp/Fnr family transcriptional regulator n=1 Tax=Winogradskyella sp. TaxID=1883156 RepID=UPI00261131A7|nr:Crp/Fnr family transcriptional regulator [Winogradskyella sp.]